MRGIPFKFRKEKCVKSSVQNCVSAMYGKDEIIKVEQNISKRTLKERALLRLRSIKQKCKCSIIKNTCMLVYDIYAISMSIGLLVTSCKPVPQHCNSEIMETAHTDSVPTETWSQAVPFADTRCVTKPQHCIRPSLLPSTSP